jgi:hypothetical protein
MAPTDYKRFLAFLYQFNGNLPVQRYRSGRSLDETDEMNSSEREPRAAGSQSR